MSYEKDHVFLSDPLPLMLVAHTSIYMFLYMVNCSQHKEKTFTNTLKRKFDTNKWTFASKKYLANYKC